MGRKVHVSTSVILAPWREIGLGLQKVMGNDPYEFELEPNADLANPRGIANGQCEIGITMPPFVDWANRRIEAYADESFPEFLVIAAVNRPAWMTAGVVRSAGISSLTELKEKQHPWRFRAPARDAMFGIYVDRLLEAHGFSREAIGGWGGGEPPPSPVQMGPGGMRVSSTSAAPEARRGEIDGYFMYMYLTAGWAREITTFLDVKSLSFDERAVDTVIQRLGGQKLILPARAFPGVDEDIVCLGWRHIYIYGTADTEPDLIRAIIRALEQSPDRFMENAHGISYSGTVIPALVPGVKLHPVAEEYYRSRGYPQAA